ncbi:helix-turn-helix domain-containing protein [Paenibacillus sp. CECT 9249]|uniref:helix-turn-helix domain-containing protein n=1 Tax=Paenibacillus sp. CECT 9249 TaxID=2845385 RepID=UPI0025B6EC00|nr:helix-turn-helix domain-containing protein [Paenibacillus sp. CECT 9249]
MVVIMFSKRLAELRRQQNKTQQEMADYLGITRPAFTAYESGTREPDYKTLIKLADFLNTNTDYLLGRTDNPSPTIFSNNESIREEANVAYFGKTKEELTEEEADRLKEELEMYRALKEKRMRENNVT